MTIDPINSIPAFYAGQSIFLTGATGFLGIVFIEKVLRSCPDVHEIFLLMRPKKGLSINKRLEEMLNSPLYEKLREQRPSNFEKLVPISGDVSEKELGLSVADRQMLIERVTIVIHAASDVKFNMSLKYAISTNIRGTRDICILAQNMKNLISLVYVSTAFAHVNETIIEEKTYPPIADWRKMIKMAESLDEHTLTVFTAKCLGYAPNTYIFSKNLAEGVIREYSSSLPCAIIRPSMVVSMEKDPIPGWLNNYYGPIGISIGCAKGIIRVLYTNKTVNEDMVPVDVVIKAIIVLSWKRGLTTFTEDSTTFVLNCTNQKRFSYQSNTELLLSVQNEIPLERIIWTPDLMLIDNFVLFYILMLLLHILPAVLIDLISKISGHQLRLLRLQRQLYVVNNVMSYFMFREWKYNKANMKTLISSIPPDNLDMFSFDYSYLDLRNFFINAVIGVKKYCIREDINRLDAVKAYNKRVDLFATLVKTIIYIGILWIIYKWTLY